MVRNVIAGCLIALALGTPSGFTQVAEGDYSRRTAPQKSHYRVYYYRTDIKNARVHLYGKYKSEARARDAFYYLISFPNIRAYIR
jgi:hypothetical protein